MLNSWLVRPSPHGTNRLAEFLDNNIIAIGWPGINDLSDKTHEQLRTLLSEPPYKLSSLKLGNASATINIFVNHMNIDDLVLVPDGDDIHFCTIKSDYFFDPNYEQDGYPHQRKVEWLTSTQRTDLPMDLRMSLKVHRATANLSQHTDVINALAHGTTLPQDTPSNNKGSSVSVDYPLRPDVSIKITVPQDITRAESKRLGDFIKTIYFG